MWFEISLYIKTFTKDFNWKIWEQFWYLLDGCISLRISITHLKFQNKCVELVVQVVNFRGFGFELSSPYRYIITIYIPEMNASPQVSVGFLLLIRFLRTSLIFLSSDTQGQLKDGPRLIEHLGLRFWSKFDQAFFKRRVPANKVG